MRLSRQICLRLVKDSDVSPKAGCQRTFNQIYNDNEEHAWTSVPQPQRTTTPGFAKGIWLSGFRGAKLRDHDLAHCPGTSQRERTLPQNLWATVLRSVLHHDDDFCIVWVCD